MMAVALATCIEARLLLYQELEAMKKRVKEMEEEAAKLREMQAQVEKEMTASGLDSTSLILGFVRPH